MKFARAPGVLTSDSPRRNASTKRSASKFERSRRRVGDSTTKSSCARRNEGFTSTSNRDNQHGNRDHPQKRWRAGVRWRTDDSGPLSAAYGQEHHNMAIHHALSSALINIRKKRGPHLHPDAAAHAETPTFSTGHVEVLDDHGADSSSEKAACLQAGDDGSRRIVKGQASFDLLDLAMVPPTWMTWTPKVAVFIAPRIATSSTPRAQACICEPATHGWLYSPCRLTTAERRAPRGFR